MVGPCIFFWLDSLDSMHLIKWFWIIYKFWLFQIFVLIFLSSLVSFFFFLIGETEWERLESFVTENDKGILVFDLVFCQT